MNKNVKIAKELVKLAKALVVKNQKVADINQPAGMEALLRAIVNYPDTPEGNARLAAKMKELINGLFQQRNGLDSYYDAYRAAKMERVMKLKETFGEQLAKGYRETGNGKNKKIITVNDIGDLSQQLVSELTNAMGFHTVQPAMFPSLDESGTSKPLQEKVKMPELMQDPNNPTNIIQNEGTVSLNSTPYLNLPYQLLLSTGCVGEFDLFVTRQARDMSKNLMDNKFQLCTTDDVKSLGANLYIAAGKQPTMLKKFLDNAVKSAELNKLLGDKKIIMIPMLESMRSLLGIIVDANQRIVLYDTSINQELIKIEEGIKQKDAVIAERLQKQEENPKLKKLPEFSTLDEKIKSERGQGEEDGGFKMSRAKNNKRTFEASIHNAGLGEWWKSFKNKVKQIWSGLKSAIEKLANLVVDIKRDMLGYSDKIKDGIKKCDEADQKVIDNIAEQQRLFNKFVEDLNNECKRIIAENP